jgi:hypothetical protein
MPRHHYVPRFLLNQWATNGRFVAYFFEPAAGQVIENAKAIVASACQIPNLNTFFGVPASESDLPETKFFTPVVDTPAAAALQVMLAKGVRALSAKQRMDWARLLVSFAVRTPETLQQMGPQETIKAFDLVKAIAKGPPEEEAKVTALIEANLELFKQNFPRNIAMELSTDPQKLYAVNGMSWWIRRWCRPTILIGDRPVLTFPRMRYPCGIPLDNPRCLIALPIAPNAVFFASADPKTKSKTRMMPLSKIALKVNGETICRSTSVVYARDKSLASFVMPKVQRKAK